ncbi:MAG: phospholipase [Gemmatimonadota bacterium]|nr:phospholipase [Gemmatimonadota bacterium]
MAGDPIEHVVLLMLENHSFDQMLGCLQDICSDLDGIDSSATPRFNLDLDGTRVLQIPTDEQQFERDPSHETVDVLEQLADGNAGFVQNFHRRLPGNTANDRQDVMSYYPLDFLPALHTLGRHFTVCDRWFSSLPGPTWPNRFFALSGTSRGRVLMPGGLKNLRVGEAMCQDQVTLFDRLSEAGKSWRIYYYDFPISLVLDRQRQAHNLANYSLIKHFFADAAAPEPFPDFVFIEPKYLGADQNDDHPPHNVFKAEKLVADVYNAVRSNSALWGCTILVITYDEHGGFYDHVVPPPAPPPDEYREEWTFDQLGVRVPAILVSPWVRAGVVHTQFDHTSLLKYLTDKWALGPLGERTRTANSIGTALTERAARETTPLFIRVPYSDLIPPKPELEQQDESRHHRAIRAFATFLATEEAVVAGDLVDILARGAGWWVRAQDFIGTALQRFGRRLARPQDRQRENRVAAIAQVARARIGSTERPPEAGANGSQSSPAAD